MLAVLDFTSIATSWGGPLMAVVVFIYLARKLPSERRELNSRASDLEENIRKNLLEEVDRQMGTMREEVLTADAARARAEAALSQAQAELATVVAKSSEERHALKNEILVREGRVRALEDEVRHLRDELGTLKARLGVQERRR